MEQNLINAYAHGNLQRALLLLLFADKIKASCKAQLPASATDETRRLCLQKEIDNLQASLFQPLRLADFEGDPHAEEIRAWSLHLAKRFANDLQDILLPELLQ